jgi:hypothetical protein
VKAEKSGKLGKENEENNIIKILLQVSNRPIGHQSLFGINAKFWKA